MNGESGVPNLWLLSALVMFAAGIIASGVLLFSTAFMARQHHDNGEPLKVDLNRLIRDRMILNVALAGLLLIENSTLIWDSLTDCRHFPIQVRWPLDLIIICAVCFSSLRLFKLYVEVFHEARHGR